METTVYVEEEKVALIADPEVWQAKVKELGLEGQEQIFADGKKANPFLRMDSHLVRVFETLCPTKKPIEKFDVEPIPLAALGAYGLAVHENYFERVEIWYSPGQPDPVMIGTVKNEQFLMAQWGPEKVSLDELAKRARTRWIKENAPKAKRAAEM